MNKICKNCRKSTPNKDGYCDECKREWRRTHPVKENRPSASKRGYNARWHRFAQMFLRMHPVCAMCGRPSQVVDHKTYTARQMMDAYGEFDYNPELYQALCFRCNGIKGRTTDRVKDVEYFKDKETLGGGDFFSAQRNNQRGSGNSHTQVEFGIENQDKKE